MRRVGLLLILLSALACSEEPSAAPSATAPQAPLAAASGVTTAHPSGSAHVTAGPPTCGASGLPDCPLQAFMKANATTALEARRFERLTEVLKRVATLAPAGYSHWNEIALAGVDAAASGKADQVRAACKSCHDAYRSTYRREHRAEPLR